MVFFSASPLSLSLSPTLPGKLLSLSTQDFLSFVASKPFIAFATLAAFPLIHRSSLSLILLLLLLLARPLSAL